MKTIIPKIYFTAYKKDGSSKIYKNLTAQRIHGLLASHLTKTRYSNFHLKVVYGKQKCVQGCLCTFDNEVRGNASDIKWGLKAFLDKDLYM